MFRFHREISFETSQTTDLQSMPRASAPGRAWAKAHLLLQASLISMRWQQQQLAMQGGRQAPP
jgi:hypothetical protein